MNEKEKKKKEKGREKRKRRRRKIISGILFVITLAAFSIPLYSLIRMTLIGPIEIGPVKIGPVDPRISISVTVGLVIFLIIWLAKSIIVVSTAKMGEREVPEEERKEREVPVQVIITRLGKPVRALAPGIHLIWWPVDRIRRVLPTIVYKLDIPEFVVHTHAEEKGERTKRVKVSVTVHMSFPMVGGEYNLEEEGLEKDKIPRPWREILEPDTYIVTAEKLLVNCTYYALSPAVPLDEMRMTTHFTKAIQDGVRAKMVDRTYTSCRENKTKVEKDIKDYLLTDPANLFVKTGIPPILLDISITNMEATNPRIEDALWLPEIETTEGRAEAQRRIEAIGGAHKGIKTSFARNLPAAEKDRMSKSYVSQQMSLDKDALNHIKLDGVEGGLEKSIFGGVALLGKVLGDGMKKALAEKAPPAPKEKLPEEMTDEELREIERRMYGE